MERSIVRFSVVSNTFLTYRPGVIAFKTTLTISLSLYPFPFPSLICFNKVIYNNLSLFPTSYISLWILISLWKALLLLVTAETLRNSDKTLPTSNLLSSSADFAQFCSTSPLFFNSSRGGICIFRSICYNRSSSSTHISRLVIYSTHSFLKCSLLIQLPKYFLLFLGKYSYLFLFRRSSSILSLIDFIVLILFGGGFISIGNKFI